MLRLKSWFGLDHFFDGPMILFIDPVDAKEAHCVTRRFLCSAVKHAPAARQVVRVSHIQLGDHFPNHPGNIFPISTVVQHDERFIEGGIPVHGMHVFHIERVAEQTPSVDDHLPPRLARLKIQEQSLNQDRFFLHAHRIKQVPSFGGCTQEARSIGQRIEQQCRTVEICFGVHVVRIDGDMEWWLFGLDHSRPHQVDVVSSSDERADISRGYIEMTSTSQYAFKIQHHLIRSDHQVIIHHGFQFDRIVFGLWRSTPKELAFGNLWDDPYPFSFVTEEVGFQLDFHARGHHRAFENAVFIAQILDLCVLAHGHERCF